MEMAIKTARFYYCEKAAQFAEVMLAMWMGVERAPNK